MPEKEQVATLKRLSDGAKYLVYAPTSLIGQDPSRCEVVLRRGVGGRFVGEIVFENEMIRFRDFGNPDRPRVNGVPLEREEECAQHD